MAGWASDATKRLFEEMIARGENCTIETVPWKVANDGAVEGSGLNKHDKVEVSPSETSLTCNDLPLRFLGDLRRIYTLFDYQDVVDSENGASFIVDAFIENGKPAGLIDVDESVVHIDEALHSILLEEIKVVLGRLDVAKYKKTPQLQQCPFCPFKSFKSGVHQRTATPLIGSGWKYIVPSHQDIYLFRCVGGDLYH